MIGISLFKIGSATIYTYGAFLVIGVLLSCLAMFFMARSSGKQAAYLLDYIVYTALFGIIGARISFYIIYHSQFSSFVDIFKIWQGGLISYGGFILGIIAFILIVRSTKEKILPWLDILIVSALLGLAVGRFGSFLSGELAGIAATGSFAINGLYPVTLFEAIWNLIIFAFFFIFFMLGNSRIKSGVIAAQALAMYSLGRFFIEFYRAEDKIFIGLSISQIILIVIFAFACILFIKQISFRKKGARNA
ncbi:MAG: prolipoprotein diacylglyceryl transferase family protein [Patescibacteria group bacterium]